MSTCATCQRPIAGDAADVTICVVDPVEGPMVLCAGCFWADPRRLGWTEWRAPVPEDAYPLLAEVGT